MESLELVTLGVASKAEAKVRASDLERQLRSAKSDERAGIASMLARIYTHLNEPGKAVVSAGIAAENGNSEVYAYCAQIAISEMYHSAAAMMIERLREHAPKTAASIDVEYRKALNE